MKVKSVTLESSDGQAITLTTEDVAMSKTMTVITPSGARLALPPSDITDLAKIVTAMASQA